MCGGLLYYKGIDSNVSLSEPQLGRFKFKIFPNPTENILNIDLLDMNKIVRYDYQIVDVLGNIVAKKTLQDCKESINIQNLEKGVYFICIKIANSTASKRFIKI